MKVVGTVPRPYTDEKDYGSPSAGFSLNSKVASDRIRSPEPAWFCSSHGPEGKIGGSHQVFFFFFHIAYRKGRKKRFNKTSKKASVQDDDTRFVIISSVHKFVQFIRQVVIRRFMQTFVSPPLSLSLSLGVSFSSGNMLNGGIPRNMPGDKL